MFPTKRNIIFHEICTTKHKLYENIQEKVNLTRNKNRIGGVMASMLT